MYTLHLQCSVPAATPHPPPSRSPRSSRATQPSIATITTPPSLTAVPTTRSRRAPPPPRAENPRTDHQDEPRPNGGGFWAKWMAESAEMRTRVTKLGLAAVLAYGLFDAVTYTAFFVLAFLGYEKSTGKNPAANLKALLGIVILMWTGNNVTRPFRVAGAAALAPVIDRGLKGIQEKLNLPSQMYSFALVVGSAATVCLTVVSFLILSKWGK